MMITLTIDGNKIKAAAEACDELIIESDLSDSECLVNAARLYLKPFNFKGDVVLHYTTKGAVAFTMNTSKIIKL